jgi:anti-sigma factor RsiW
MMDFDAQLKLQAYLDGELPEKEAAEVARWVAGDQEAALLLVELRNTRASLAGYDKRIQLPETREFFWSKIQREIDRLEPASAEAPKQPAWSSLSRLLRRAGAVAAVAAVALIAAGQFGWFESSGGPAAESALADNEAFSYRDETTGTTLVWLSYPAEEEETQFEPVDKNLN